MSNARSRPRNGTTGTDENKLRRVTLTDAEARMVRTACERYRNSMPIYLSSSQADLRLIASVIRKLS